MEGISVQTRPRRIDLLSALAVRQIPTKALGRRKASRMKSTAKTLGKV